MVFVKKCSIFLSLFSFFLIFGIVLLTGTSSEVKFTEITLNFNFSEPIIERIGNYDRIKIEGLENFGEPGIPVLPFKTVRILLPFDEEIEDIQVAGKYKTYLTGNYLVEPGQKPVPIILNITNFTTPNETVYNSLTPFPNKLYSKPYIQEFRGYKILILNLYPVHYIPKMRKIYYYKSMEVKVRMKPLQKSLTLQDIQRSNFRGLEKDEDKVKKIVDNPEMLSSYERIKNLLLNLKKSTFQPKSLVDPSKSYDYVIITTSQFNSSFWPLVEWKKTRPKNPINATIVLVEDIVNNPDYWCDGKWGDGCAIPEFNDTQAKIRNFIKDAYNNWGIEYVLLGGDADGGNVGGESGNNIIPHRGFYARVESEGEVDFDIPADLYYAALNGTWNNDLDDEWGEEGEEDFYAEVYVGRAPVDSVEEVQNFVNKTIAYENATLHKDPYLRKVLMAGEWLGFYMGYAKRFKEEIRWGTCNYGYCTAGFPGIYYVSTLYDADQFWSPNELILKINDNLHAINHLGHANNLNAMKLEITDVDNNLTNTKYFFVYSQGCYAGAFDNRNTAGSYLENDSIAEHLVTSKNGSFAVIMNSRYGWGTGWPSTDGPSQRFDRQFWDAIFNESLLNLGKANQDSKEDNIGFVLSDPPCTTEEWPCNGVMRWVYYELNLLGDPETPFSIPEPPAHNLRMRAIVTGTFELGKESLINVTVENAGTNDESNVLINLTLDNNFLTSVTIPSIKARTTVTKSIKWVPTTSGTHYLNVTISPVLGEEFFDDNWMGKEIYIKAPDLKTEDILMNVTFPSPKAGDPIELRINVANVGDADATSFKVNISIFNPSGNLTQSENISVFGLPVNASREIKYLWIPSTNGTWRVVVEADYGNLITESNENNNRAERRILVGGVNHTKWTIMVYLDGDNNLESAAIDDINEMESIGSTNDVSIVVQFDRSPYFDTSNGDWTDARRFYIMRDPEGSGNWNITSPLLEILGEVNMADPYILVDFINWTIQNFPADNYALILWNHGSGWYYSQNLNLSTLNENTTKTSVFPLGVIWDDTSNDHLDLEELEFALNSIKSATGKNINLLGFDACLMQMVEVAYQFVPYSEVMVGSEETEPADGWPYDLILENLTQNPSMTSSQLAKVIVEKYGEFYGTSGKETQSAINQSNLFNLIKSINEFASLLKESIPTYKDKITKARLNAEFYDYPDHIDLYHFASLINSTIINQTIQSASESVMNNISNAIIAEFHGGMHPNSHGITIYFPISGKEFNYERIKFASETQWDEFLDSFSYNPPVFIPGSKIILVDDDSGKFYEFWFKDALRANGYNYSYWSVYDNGLPPIEILNTYPIVIWFSETFPTYGWIKVLQPYLENGGRLFITGQGIGWLYGYTDFYKNYLHANYEGATSIRELTGVYGDPIGHELTIGISGGDGANNQGSPDVITPADEYASLIFNYTSNGGGAIKVNTTNYKVVYFAFGFEAINNSDDRNEVMKRVIEWLNPIILEAPLTVNYNETFTLNATVINTNVFENATGVNITLLLPTAINVTQIVAKEEQISSYEKLNYNWYIPLVSSNSSKRFIELSLPSPFYEKINNASLFINNNLVASGIYLNESNPIQTFDITSVVTECSSVPINLTVGQDSSAYLNVTYIEEFSNPFILPQQDPLHQLGDIANKTSSNTSWNITLKDLTCALGGKWKIEGKVNSSNNVINETGYTFVDVGHKLKIIAPNWVKSGEEFNFTVVDETGGVVANAIITVSDSGKNVQLITNADGNASYTSYGYGRLIAWSYKNLYQASDSIAVGIDAFPPSILGKNPVQYANTRPTISFSIVDWDSGVDTSSIEVYVNETKIVPKIKQISSYVFEVSNSTLTISPGTIVVKVNASDKVGNLLTHEWSFVVDNLSPVIMNERPVSNAYGSIKPTIKVDVVDFDSGVDESSIRMNINGLIVKPNTISITKGYRAEYQYPYAFTPGETVTISISATDKVGNKMPISSWSFTTQEVSVSTELSNYNPQENEKVTVSGKAIYTPANTPIINTPFFIWLDNSLLTKAWNIKAPMPTARGFFASGVVNGKIYIIGGANSTHQNLTIVEVYDPSSNSWSEGHAQMPTGRKLAASTIVNDKIYVIGGDDGNIQLNATEIYDPKANSWRIGTPMPTPRTAPTASVINDEIYVIGGYNGSFLNIVETYNVTSNTWSTKAPMKNARAGAVALTINNKIYVIGGYNGSSALASVEIYDPTTNAWTESSQMLMPRYLHAAAFLNNKIYVFGGMSKAEFLNETEIYDLSINKWTGGPAIFNKRVGHAAMALNDKIYLVGGYNESEEPLKLTEEFNPYYLTDSEGKYSFAFNAPGPGTHVVKVNLITPEEIYGENIVQFKVLEKAAPPTPTPSPLPIPTPTYVYDFDVTLPEKIEIFTNESKQFDLIVKNIANGTLTDLQAKVRSEPYCCVIKITPEKIDLLKPKNSTSFLVSIPSGIKAGNYKLIFNISSKQVWKEASMQLIVKELPKVDIFAPLLEKLTGLFSLVLEKEKEGYEVKEVRELLKSAMEACKAKDYEKCSSLTKEAEKLLKEIKKPFSPILLIVAIIFVVVGAVATTTILISRRETLAFKPAKDLLERIEQIKLEVGKISERGIDVSDILKELELAKHAAKLGLRDTTNMHLRNAVKLIEEKLKS